MTGHEETEAALLGVIVADRLVRERSRRGWSMGDVANRMAEAGCPIPRSAIERIEKQTRSIKLHEATALARVLGVELDNLLTPLSTLDDDEARALLKDAVEGMGQAYEAGAVLARVIRTLAHRTGGSDDDAEVSEGTQRMFAYQAPAGPAGSSPDDAVATACLHDALEALRSIAWHLGLAQLDAVGSKRHEGRYVITREGFSYTSMPLPPGDPPPGVIVLDSETVRGLSY